MEIRLGRVLVAVLAVALTLVGVSAPVSSRVSTHVPAGFPALDAHSDGPARRLLASSPDARFSRGLRAVAVDCDRDGDQDVVGLTSDDTFVVWINDGRGRLHRRTLPRSVPLMSAVHGLGEGHVVSLISVPPTPRRWLGLPSLLIISRPPDVIRVDHHERVAHTTLDGVGRLGSSRAPPATLVAL